MDALVFHGWVMRALRFLRAAILLPLFFALTLPLMAVQYALLKLRLPQAKTLPQAYHKMVCRLFGIRVHLVGEIDPNHPVLLVSNHISWLDIPVLSTVAPLSFVAKAEVATWPFVSALAKLQRSVFVDRARRTLVKDKAGEIAERLLQGDTVVLFAEGTSSDGNRVLPFRSSLFSAVQMTKASTDVEMDAALPKPVVQTLALSYTHLHGLPILRHERPLIAWYGDMDMMQHAWAILKSGPLDVTIRIGAPVALSEVSDRKKLAAYSEAQVRRDYIETLTSRSWAA